MGVYEELVRLRNESNYEDIEIYSAAKDAIEHLPSLEFTMELVELLAFSAEYPLSNYPALEALWLDPHDQAA